MGDFTAIEAAFKQVLSELGLKAWYKLAPVVLTHLVPQVEGGYTNVELRAFREAALGAGASQSYLLADYPPLSVAERQDVAHFFK